MSKNYWKAYLELKAEKQHFYPREAAKHMAISEFELMSSHPGATYLGGEARKIVLRLKALGLVECIVRNDISVHEKTGVYENVSMTKTMGIALNVGELDLRIFARHWQHVLAVKDTSREPVSYSIQFYDEHGDAIQKVFLRDDSKINAWEDLVNTFASEEKPENITPATMVPSSPHQLDDSQRVAFQQRWLELKDVHHFSGILETFSLSRLDAYRQAPENYTFEVKNTAFEEVFQAAKQHQIKIMIFVANRGIAQIQSGYVHHIKRMHGYLNILDKKEENFCLHLLDEAIAHTWVVRRPTRDGIVTCLEGMDKDGKTVITVFGLRQEGEAEQSRWQEITQTLYVA